MKKGYWVVAYRSISDPNVLAEYGKLAGPATAAFGGRGIIRTAEPAEAHEQGLNNRVVVVEFDSVDNAKAAYHSDAYKKALEVLGNTTERDFRIVEGL